MKDLKTSLGSGYLREKLASCGVYAIIASEGYEPKFLSGDEVNKRGKRRVIDPKPIGELKRKWVEGAEALYIGCAGERSRRHLRGRLRALNTHFEGRAGKTGPHRGGEIIWQLGGSEEFRCRLSQPVSHQNPRGWNRSC